MRRKPMMMAMVIGTLISVTSLAGAADEQQKSPPAAGMEGEQGTGIDDRGMKPGMGAMQGCEMMGMQGAGVMPGPTMHGGMGQMNGMMPRGMGGMNGMMPRGMGGMDRMMPRRMGGMGGMMPQLPPGNEKLQLQMQAEMMQKMGEILGKYAERIKEAPAATP